MPALFTWIVALILSCYLVLLGFVCKMRAASPYQRLEAAVLDCYLFSVEKNLGVSVERLQGPLSHFPAALFYQLAPPAALQRVLVRFKENLSAPVTLEPAIGGLK